MKKVVLFLLFSGSCWFGCTAFAAEEIITIKSTITGSQEQPKVISIVPWQKPEDPDYFGQDETALAGLPEIFRPLDRQSFAREREYLSVMRKGAKK